MATNWMLYGAYGYTGRLIAAEAVARGERPVLAGRNGAALQEMAAALGLEALTLSLDDPERLRAAIAPFGAVLHAAGPYVRTAAPMRAACLATQTHYLDITGEVPVFVDSLATDASARAAGVAVISGVGFDIVPTDCLGALVAARLPGATQLDLAIAGFDAASGGTVITALEQMEAGGLVRRKGALVAWPLGRGARQIRFGDGVARWAIPTPMGDVATAQQSTGIPNVTVYVVFPAARLLPVLTPLTRWIFGFGPLRRGAQALAARLMDGPDETRRRLGRTRFWARATAADGRFAEAWLETAEAYQFTAEAAVAAVRRVLVDRPVGALTPSQAFGADFVLGLGQSQMQLEQNNEQALKT
jgi:short subunit dehydrogenase-like uncharacterized protein